MNLKEFCEKNWYILSDTLPKNLYRYWDDKISITTIISILKDPSLEYVIKYHQDKIDEACVEWIRIHKQAEEFFRKWSWVSEININFMSWLILKGLDIVKTESSYYKEWIRWTIDAVWYSIKDKKFYNIDYKNTNKHSEKYCLQLWGYKWLNWFDWVLLYWKWKLNIIEAWEEYEKIFIELKDYFFNLINKKLWKI